MAEVIERKYDFIHLNHLIFNSLPMTVEEKKEYEARLHALKGKIVGVIEEERRDCDEVPQM